MAKKTTQNKDKAKNDESNRETENKPEEPTPQPNPQVPPVSVDADVLKIHELTDDERELFHSVLGSSIAALNSTYSLQEVEGPHADKYFRRNCGASLKLATMYVEEYRKLTCSQE